MKRIRRSRAAGRGIRRNLRGLCWLLLVGCSGTGNSFESSSFNPLDGLPNDSCLDGPLTDFSYCPARYLPGTDGPEQICRPWDVGFNAGSIQGSGVLDNGDRNHFYFQCMYDPRSGALVGLNYLAGTFYCSEGSSAPDDLEGFHALSWVPCPGDSSKLPLLQWKR